MVRFVIGCVFLGREALAQWQCVGQLRISLQEGKSSLERGFQNAKVYKECLCLSWERGNTSQAINRLGSHYHVHQPSDVIYFTEGIVVFRALDRCH